jgi:hypothetical protein
MQEVFRSQVPSRYSRSKDWRGCDRRERKAALATAAGSGTESRAPRADHCGAHRDRLAVVIRDNFPERSLGLQAAVIAVMGAAASQSPGLQIKGASEIRAADSLTAANIDESTLSQVPSAASADSVGSENFVSTAVSLAPYAMIRPHCPTKLSACWILQPRETRPDHDESSRRHLPARSNDRDIAA